jgi:hypothetical protein
MSKRRLVFVIAAALALSGCCLEGGCYIQPPTNLLKSWDGLGPIPKRIVKRAKVRKTSETATLEDKSPSEEELPKLRPYSKEWSAVFNAINSAADAKLKKKLIICRGCMPPEPNDLTSSIGAGGYLPFRQ